MTGEDSPAVVNNDCGMNGESKIALGMSFCFFLPGGAAVGMADINLILNVHYIVFYSELIKEKVGNAESTKV